MRVRELMSTEVVTVSVDATVGDAVDRLLDNGIGSVIVVDADGNPAGIVTESDVLRAARETGEPLGDIDIGTAGHSPVVTTSPSRSVSTVARLMADEGVKKVPVLEGIDMVGIVTLTDIVWHLSALRRELADADGLRDEWGPTSE
jgi:CBS domain-containing protein